MFGSHRRLFSLCAGMQTLLVLLSGVPRLECACREVVVRFLPGNGHVRSSSCCCDSSSFLTNLDGTTDRPKNGASSCCRRSQASSQNKVTDGVCASHPSGCHRKLVPPGAAVRIAPPTVIAESVTHWLALDTAANPVHWLAPESLGRSGLRPEPSGPPTGCLHRVLRI